MTENEEEYKRRQPPIESYVDRGPEVVASTLAPQLGTEATELTKGKTDMRLLSVIEERDIPFFIYAKIRGRKSRIWETLYEEKLRLNVSVGGRGRRDIIRMEGVSKGGMPGVESEIPEKPGFLARNIWKRDWREKAEKDRL